MGDDTPAAEARPTPTPAVRGMRFVTRGMVVPPPRPGVRHVRVPFVGLVIADDDLRRRVDRFFYWPMIMLALAILPLLAWEFLWPPDAGTWTWWASAAAVSIIWGAFFIEFAIKVAIAECRLEYCRRNWLDIVVLCLPLLRPIRVAALARTGRVFALRGVGMKLLRYVVTLLIGLEATDRFRRRLGVQPHRDRRNPMQMTRDELIREVRRTRALIDRWEQWHASLVEHLSIHAPDEVAPPPPETLDDTLPATPPDRVPADPEATCDPELARDPEERRDRQGALSTPATVPRPPDHSEFPAPPHSGD